MTDCPCTQWPDAYCEECERREIGAARSTAESDLAFVAARVRQRRLAVLLAVGIAAAGLVLAVRVLGW